MLLKIHPDNPNPHEINIAIDHLKAGQVIIYPTDTVYALACDMLNRKAVERLCQIKGVKLAQANFSLICNSLSHLSDYTKNVNTSTYKLMKKYLPGPFTFILNANNKVPKIFKSNKKTIGIRIPKNNIAFKLVEQLGNPLVSTSIHDRDEILEYTTDPELIYDRFKDLVEVTIDGGYGSNIASTIIDCTSDEPMIIREGKGVLT
ncbi:MAG TPA: threonylcarbamoyl-AMP synthase [Flavobacteriales bacterium]|nr:threonylcarbamoyl-AMP synthase [Flavobacteriales bacterium]HIA06015.1 threonylcarbamoyl-AMP synthase [Flavobacteriales bacterium]HIO71748.1 threonylcarbamoyl-AMP synthase [Flavobacteriales bacterium]